MLVAGRDRRNWRSKSLQYDPFLFSKTQGSHSEGSTQRMGTSWQALGKVDRKDRKFTLESGHQGQLLFTIIRSVLMASLEA